MTGDDLDPRRLEVAAHELGHAIAWRTVGLTAAEIQVSGHGDQAQGHVTLHPHTLDTLTAVRGYLAGLLAGREVSVRWCAEHGLRHDDHTCQGDFDRVREIRRTTLGRHVPTRVARADAQRIIRARWGLIVRLAPRLARHGRITLP